MNINIKEKQVITTLLQAYKEMGFLWQKKHPDYVNKNKRYEAFKLLLNIYKEFDPTADVLLVKKKIVNMRSIFCREAKRVLESRRSGADQPHVPVLWYYDLLTFLDPRADPYYNNEDIEQCIVMSQNQGESSQKKSGPGPKKVLHTNYNLVKRRCIELVKNGFPAAIIDDEAFQGILNLIPMNEDARKGLTAEYIQKLVADNDNDETQMEDDDDDDDPLQGNDDYDDDEPETTTTQRRAVKVEIETGDECTCAQKDADAHELDCPMASKLLPFLNYYELFMDEAKCTLCRTQIKWTEVTELKDHLDKNHPNIRYEDHPPDRTEYLDSDNSYFDDGKPRRQKERDVSFKEKDVSFKEKSFFGDKEKEEEREYLPPRKRMRYTDVTLKSNEKISLDQFRLLDRFGLYVAALLENLPKEKCLRYQQQIVERLLKEQAAAG